MSYLWYYLHTILINLVFLKTFLPVYFTCFLEACNFHYVSAINIVSSVCLMLRFYQHVIYPCNISCSLRIPSLYRLNKPGQYLCIKRVLSFVMEEFSAVLIPSLMYFSFSVMCFLLILCILSKQLFYRFIYFILLCMSTVSMLFIRLSLHTFR